MYKFTIKYYYARYHTGAIDNTNTREATVYAENLNVAKEKIKKGDKDFESTACVSFEEITEGKDNA